MSEDTVHCNYCKNIVDANEAVNHNSGYFCNESCMEKYQEEEESKKRDKLLESELEKLITTNPRNIFSPMEEMAIPIRFEKEEVDKLIKGSKSNVEK